MSEARTRIARLAMVGLCLTWIGCGGGGVPDPSSDSAAAPDSAPPVANSGGGGGGDAAPEAAPARERGEAVVSNDAPAEAAKPADAPADEKAAAAPKGDSSGTTELLNLGAAAPPAEVTKDAPAAGSGATPPAMIGGPGGQNASMQAPGGPGTAGGRRGMMMAPPGGPGEGGMAGPGGLPGAPGGGMPGGPGSGNDAPANFISPMSGVTSFINAVRSKDRDRIADATALRAPQEATKDSMKKLFSTILDGSVDDETIADLNKAFEGFQIVDHNEPRSSGKYGIILGKSNGKGGQFRRTVTLRKEAKGWKVCDIAGQAELEAFFPRGMTTKRKKP